VEMTGGLASTTLIIWLAEDVLPQLSVAVQTLVNVYVCGHEPGVVNPKKLRVTPLPQPSVAVAVVNTGGFGQKTVDGAGNGLITGPATSLTWMTCAAVETLPQASVAVHVLVIVYCPAQLPGVVTVACVSVNGVPQASVAVATANTGVAGHCIVEGAGNDDMTGAVISRTVIVCDAVEELPQPSVAVHVLVTL
jgi:hypothetical protein